MKPYKPYTFEYNERLGILLPQLNLEWAEYTLAQREAIVQQWEEIRGSIPERIHQFEEMINVKQEQMNTETNFTACCAINWEIAELASRINDLHLWFRINQDVGSVKSHQ